MCNIWLWSDGRVERKRGYRHTDSWHEWVQDNFYGGSATKRIVIISRNPHCKAIQVNGNNVDWVTNARHLGNVVDNKLSDLNDINAKKNHFIASVNWFVGNFRGKVPIECYIRLFQSYCSTRYGSILWPLHDRGFNDFCVTWNKGVRRMLNVSNMTHTVLLGQIINTCHITYISPQIHFLTT